MNFNELFKGFQTTPLLWNNDIVYDLRQYKIKDTLKEFTPQPEDKQLRLGKWVEKFIAFQLKQVAEVELIAENLQIKKDKLTIGELDLLLRAHKQPIHLEVVYKFYLYDTLQSYTSELEHWIGPNRNDALTYKLKKLKEKQLPLLYNSTTAEVLERFNLKIDAIKQLVCFKAQLFVPFNASDIEIKILNKNCVAGYYLSFAKINLLQDYQFFIPTKINWLLTPHNEVSWLTFKQATEDLENEIKMKRSPLVWIKNDNEIQKWFITWW